MVAARQLMDAVNDAVVDKRFDNERHGRAVDSALTPLRDAKQPEQVLYLLGDSHANAAAHGFVAAARGTHQVRASPPSRLATLTP